jgi:hypothetical protein
MDRTGLVTIIAAYMRSVYSYTDSCKEKIEVTYVDLGIRF